MTYNVKHEIKFITKMKIKKQHNSGKVQENKTIKMMLVMISSK